MGIVLTLLVLFVDASLKSRSPGPVRTLAAQTWVDRALPIIAQSTEEGDAINQVRSSGLTMTAGAITSQLNQVASGARSTLAAAQALRPPSTVAEANGALVVCLQTRAQAAGKLVNAILQTLGGAAGSGASASAPAIQTAGLQFQVADEAYHLFVQDMPPLDVSLPASVWYTNPAGFAQPGLSNFLESLRAATNTTPLHALAVDAVTTTPPAVTTNGHLEVLPPASLVTIQATVADVGNQAESSVPVSATLVPSAPGYISSVRDLVSLKPGQAQTLTLGSLRPPTNVPVTLTVTIGPVAGEAETSDNTKVITFQMP